MTTRTTRIAASLLLATALATTAGTGVALGAKKDKEKAAPAATPAAIESVAGKKYKMARATMADRVFRYADAAGDPIRGDGTPASDAPAWTDISAVYVAPAGVRLSLLEAMEDSYPPGASRTFYGNQASWERNDRAAFVAVKMAGKMPSGAAGQQLEVGLGGDEAMPVQAGTHLDTRAGIERFSLSGLFTNGVYASGSTDVSGRQPGDAVEYYNTESRGFGFYQPKNATWYLIVPRAKATDSVVVSVRSNTESGEVIDRLELPGGGNFVSLADPTGGFKKKPGVAPLTCRSLETFSADSGVELSDPEATLIRYTAGMDVEHDPDETATILGPAIEVMGAVEVTLTPVGEAGEPMTVTGDLAVAPRGNAVSLTFEAPAGQWSFELADGLELKTPAGQSIIDHASLTGTAGVLTGPGLDGFVAGDLSCASDGSQMAEEPADMAEEPADAAGADTAGADTTGADPTEETPTDAAEEEPAG